VFADTTAGNVVCIVDVSIIMGLGFVGRPKILCGSFLACGLTNLNKTVVK